MTFDEYQKLAIRTAKPMSDPVANLLHAHLGMSTEVGEFGDNLKKHWIYGQIYDIPNGEEELGDLLWYIALAAESMGASLSDIAIANITKLRMRYPDQYTNLNAALRADKQAHEQ